MGAPMSEPDFSSDFASALPGQPITAADAGDVLAGVTRALGYELRLARAVRLYLEAQHTLQLVVSGPERRRWVRRRDRVGAVLAAWVHPRKEV